MKCEICHKAEATTAITVKKDGVDSELYVCPACAEQAKGDSHAPQGAMPSAHKIKLIGGPDEPPPQFIEDFVKATIGFMQEVAEAEHTEKLVCPRCKAKWETIKEKERLGCPVCWKTFARLIREEYLGSQFGLAHRGGAPAVAKVTGKKDRRAVLERDLKDAIAREDYRLAASLKKQLDELGKGENA